MLYILHATWLGEQISALCLFQSLTSEDDYWDDSKASNFTKKINLFDENQVIMLFCYHIIYLIEMMPFVLLVFTEITDLNFCVCFEIYISTYIWKIFLYHDPMLCDENKLYHDSTFSAHLQLIQYNFVAKSITLFWYYVFIVNSCGFIFLWGILL